jgi:hypothetical protein
VAKIASDLRKPDGLVVVEPDAVVGFLAPLPVSRMWGVGKVTERRLKALGVHTLADLAAADPARLGELLGKHGSRMVEFARGADPRPVQVSRRITMTDVEIDGETIGPGEAVLTLLGSSNRDEGKWGPTAGDLDLGREGASGHLSFGSGIHHCLGSALARLEGAEAVPALVRRFPALELATDEPAWNGRIVLRGLDSLPVTLAG